jgi:hypothetical protein
MSNYFYTSTLRVLACAFVLLSLAPLASAQSDSSATVTKEATTKLKTIAKVVGSSSTKSEGLFTVFQNEDKLYFEIPDSVLSKDLLVVTRFVQTPAGLKSVGAQHGGELINNQVWRFVKRGNKIDLKVPSFTHHAEEGSDIFRSFQNSNLSPILASFDIKALGDGKETSLIDVNDFFGGEIPGMPLPDVLKKSHKVSTIDKSRSYLDRVRAYPINFEIPTVKTYKSTDLPADANVGAMTFSMNTSILRLPDEMMKPRLANKRVGYLQVEQKDFSSNDHRSIETAFVHRWRLEPKDSVAYLRGELVEPKKQIVFYIDPATPKKWVPFLIQGINDWNIAFEAAGFKNAIVGKEAPSKEEDPDFSTEDARYSLIRYYASTVQNAYGPRTIDPRSGEVLGSHVGWHHNVMVLLKKWYFIQTAAANPKARGDQLSDDEMGQLIRFVSSHEIGHTLGLMHNAGASNAFPVDSLRSKAFTDRYGTAPSIMDYARFNYIAQPEDGVTNYFPQIGIYDEWSIKWGYTWFGKNIRVAKENEILNGWVAARMGKPEFFFGRQFSSLDPRAQTEDLGDDAIGASRLGIKNLKVLLPNVEKWTYRPQKDLAELGEHYEEILRQYRRYLHHVSKYVGGMYEDYKTYDQPGAAYHYVPKAIQKNAIQFIIDELFFGSEWMVDNEVLQRFDYAIAHAKLAELKAELMGNLTDNFTISRMIDNERKNGAKAFTGRELFSVLNKSIFQGKGALSENERTMQRIYIDRLGYLIKLDKPVVESDAAINGVSPYNPSTSDWKAMVREELLTIKSQIKSSQALNKSSFMKAYHDDLLKRVDDLLK